MKYGHLINGIPTTSTVCGCRHLHPVRSFDPWQTWSVAKGALWGSISITFLCIFLMSFSASVRTHVIILCGPWNAAST